MHTCQLVIRSWAAECAFGGTCCESKATEKQRGVVLNITSFWLCSKIRAANEKQFIYSGEENHDYAIDIQVKMIILN